MPTPAARSVRTGLLAELAADVPCALAWHRAYTVHGHRGRIRSIAVHPDDSDLAAWATGYEGAFVDELEGGLPASGIASIARFEVLHREDVAGTGLEEGWRAHRVVSCAATHLVDEGEIVAWIGLLRTEGMPRFTGAELALLDARREELTRRLVALITAERPPCDGAAVFLVTGSGTVVAVSREGEPWTLVEGFVDALTGWIRDLPQGTSGSVQMLLGRLARAVRVTGADGCEAYAVTLVPCEPARSSDLLSLSPIQRRVAELAASGATNARIARTLHRSVETVRTHLARVYAILGISNRVELARRFEAIAWLVPRR